MPDQVAPPASSTPVTIGARIGDVWASTDVIASTGDPVAALRQVLLASDAELARSVRSCVASLLVAQSAPQPATEAAQSQPNRATRRATAAKKPPRKK